MFATVAMKVSVGIITLLFVALVGACLWIRHQSGELLDEQTRVALLQQAVQGHQAAEEHIRRQIEVAESIAEKQYESDQRIRRELVVIQRTLAQRLEQPDVKEWADTPHPPVVNELLNSDSNSGSDRSSNAPTEHIASHLSTRVHR